ncbi:MAG: putative lipid II flippase FtsW [Bacteroides sp.]|nr:putative lipid II flippase FtsW [Bacteroides sp.]
MAERTLNAGTVKTRKASAGSIKTTQKRSGSATVNRAKTETENVKKAETDRRNGYRSVRGAVSGEAAVESPVRSAAARAKSRLKKTVWVRSGFDYPLFTIVLILLAFGLIMMFSASYAVAYAEEGDSLFYLKKQAVFAMIGLVIMFIAANVDYYSIFAKKYVVAALSVLALALMIAVKVMGTTGNGAERWLRIGEITFQPSEILKFVVIVLFAYMIETRYKQLKDFKKGYIPFMAVLGVSCLVLMAQPHLSATIIVFAIGFAMMFVGGLNSKHLIVTVLLGIPLVILGVMALKALGYDYFDARILSFLNPEADIENDTFQTYQSLVTIGSGGLFGLGFGNSRQKYSYLPESQNDFIFPIICEELGFVGAALVILLFVILIWRGFYICTKARDKFGMMLAFGITFQMGLQALLNIAVVTNAVPNTGIALPFFSYGGTALVMQLGEMGILLSVSRKAALK